MRLEYCARDVQVTRNAVDKLNMGWNCYGSNFLDRRLEELKSGDLFNGVVLSK